MNQVEYKTQKKLWGTLGGLNDKESLTFMVEKTIEKPAKFFKIFAIFISVISIPLCFFIIGFFGLAFAYCLYHFGYKKQYEKAQALKEYIKNDPELPDS